MADMAQNAGLGEPLLDPAVLSLTRLGFQWETLDPFLFCVHHDDAYRTQPATPSSDRRHR